MQVKYTNNYSKKVIINTLFTIILLGCSQNGTANAGIFADMIQNVKSVIGVKAEAKESASSTDLDDVVIKPTLLVGDTTVGATNNKSVKEGDSDDELIFSPALDLDEYKSDAIVVYEVKEGDTLASIAKLLGVSKNTIVWANDIKDGKVKVGQSILILPVTGVTHKIKKGDTLAAIAKTYKADKDEVASYNGLTEDSDLIAGETIIIPDGEVAQEPEAKKGDKKTSVKKPAIKVFASAGDGYYARPIIGGIKTQGIHGHNGVDIGAPVGTQLLAAADGVVLAAKSGGYNGGYGSMVIISHPNGTQTVYGHMSRVDVVAGQSVVKGQGIGLSGNTGRSTGPHLHFEVRGAANPF